MARYPRLRSEHIKPVDAPVSRALARRLLVEHLVQVVRWPRDLVDGYADRFDWLAGNHDRHLDEEFEIAIIEASFDLRIAIGDIEALRRELSRAPEHPSEVMALHADLKHAEERMARCRAVIEVAEAKRATGKSDYRELLLKVANSIVAEEEAPSRPMLSRARAPL
jgi:hypothetical protein